MARRMVRATEVRVMDFDMRIKCGFLLSDDMR